MTTRNKRIDNKAEDPLPAIDPTAQRILNLFFVLDNSAEPLTTEQIVSDSDLGYGSGNADSDKRKFRRDREKLASHGVVVKEVRIAGAAENEESAWSLDRERTFAAGGIIDVQDAELLRAAIDQTLQEGTSPFADPLEQIRSKIDALAGGQQPSSAPAARHAPMADAVWSAFAEQRSLRFVYCNGRGEQSERTVCIYGIFERDGRGYFCGLDDATGSVRTFRSGRIVKAWKPTKTYRIPADFNLNDHIFFEFDFSENEPVAATFAFSPDSPENMIRAISAGRGHLAFVDSHWQWTVDVRSIKGAASFCMRHALDGMRPQAPQALLDAWNHLIEGTVAAHA